MAEIVNLRTVRKQKGREDKAKAAEENRLRFGRTKAERERTEAEAALADKHLDSHKRED